ncbi:MAG: DUF3990 domain-containing protein [Prevotellaceae bacterium]|jgi:hypothetical protein|nr:DUF3990 domain-containing protein [Prevotellaceae bacterium]
MKVYHGSNRAIDEIDLAQCLPGRDFGQGFYVTNIRRQAEIWAERKAAEQPGKGVVTEYDFNEYAYVYSKLNVLRFDAYSPAWLDFILLNRSNMGHQAHHYDLIEGPVADDQVASRIYLYQAGRISKKQFLEELKFKKPTHQLCFCTPASLQMLTLSGKTSDAELMQLSQHIVEQLMTDFGWNEIEAVNHWYQSETYIELTNQGTADLHPTRWRKVYEALLNENRPL